MITKSDRREYARFRKQLKRNGYLTIQESVLIKLIHNTSFAKKELEMLESYSPKNSAIYAIPISISDFFKLTSLSDKKFDFEFFTGKTIFL